MNPVGRFATRLGRLFDLGIPEIEAFHLRHCDAIPGFRGRTASAQGWRRRRLGHCELRSGGTTAPDLRPSSLETHGFPCSVILLATSCHFLWGIPGPSCLARNQVARANVQEVIRLSRMGIPAIRD